MTLKIFYCSDNTVKGWLNQRHDKNILAGIINIKLPECVYRMTCFQHLRKTKSVLNILNKANVSIALEKLYCGQHPLLIVVCPTLFLASFWMTRD